MNKTSGHKLSVVGAFVLGLGTVSSAWAAQGTVIGAMADIGSNAAHAMSSTVVISSSVHSPQDGLDADGTCSMCWIDINSDTDGDEATMEVYYEDDGQDFSGDFDLEIKLNDGTFRYDSVNNTSIVHQGTKYYTIASGSNWDWNDVAHVTMQAFRGPN